MSIPWVVMRQRRKESRRSLTEQKKTTIIISGFKKEKEGYLAALFALIFQHSVQSQNPALGDTEILSRQEAPV
jgi:hypothetical protein